MAKITDINSLFHHIVDTAKIETEAEWIIAHTLVDQNFPAPAAAVAPAAAETTPPPAEAAPAADQTTPPPAEAAPAADQTTPPQA